MPPCCKQHMDRVNKAPGTYTHFLGDRMNFKRRLATFQNYIGLEDFRFILTGSANKWLVSEEISAQRHCTTSGHKISRMLMVDL